MIAKPSERPVNIHERKPITMPLALIAMLVTFTAAVTLAYAALGQRIDSATEKANLAALTTEALEKRTRAVENIQERMANDIGWMRQAMEEDRRRRSQ